MILVDHHEQQLKVALVNLFRHMGNFNPKCLKEYFTVKLNS